MHSDKITPPRAGKWNRWKRLAQGWGAGTLFYWWLVSKVQAQQLAAAGVVGVVATAADAAVACRAGLSFSFEWRWLGLLMRRLPRRIAGDLGLLAGALAGPSGGTGVFRTLRFVRGKPGPKAAGRRALVMAAASLPPNSFAVSLEGPNGLLVHQLVFSAPPQDPEWPV